MLSLVALTAAVAATTMTTTTTMAAMVNQMVTSVAAAANVRMGETVAVAVAVAVMLSRCGGTTSMRRGWMRREKLGHVQQGIQ